MGGSRDPESPETLKEHAVPEFGIAHLVVVFVVVVTVVVVVSGIQRSQGFCPRLSHFRADPLPTPDHSWVRSIMGSRAS
jgi:hypothetical protein